MFRKFLALFLSIITILSTFMLTACNGGVGNGAGDGGNDGYVNDEEMYKNIYSAYVIYAQQNGQESLSYEAWLESIKGKDGANGANGITPELKLLGSTLYVSYDKGASWETLGDVKGDKGDPGKNGTDGVGIKDIGTEFFERDGKAYVRFTYYFTDNTTKITDICLGNVQSSVPDVPNTPDDSEEAIEVYVSEIRGGELGTLYQTEGIVVGVNAQSFIIGDDTGLILVYMGESWNPDLAVGDVVMVVGKSALYGTAVQLANSPTYTKYSQQLIELPEAQELTGEIMNYLTEIPYPIYGSVTGTLTISGNYYNIVVDGTDKFGSISYPDASLAEELQLLDGQVITAVGFLTGITGGGKYFNLLANDISTPDDEPVEPEEPESEKIHITFYHTMGQNLRNVLDAYIAEFEALYPEYKIDHVRIGGYDDVRDQIATEITVGEQPNIAYCYPDHVALYNIASAVKILDGYIDSTEEIVRADGTSEIIGLTDEQKADFIQAFYDEGRQFGDGLMYTMPMSKSTDVLYYNKTYFEENGLTVPTTWDEMEEVCKKILEIENSKLSAADKATGKVADVIPLGYDSEANWFITMCEQMDLPYTSVDGEQFLFNTEDHYDFVAKFREWYLKGYVTTLEIHGAYTSSLFTAKTGTKSYMSIGSSAGATHQRPALNANGEYPFEVGIAPIPQFNKEDPKAISQGPSLCIFEGSEEEMLGSWLFMKFLTTNAAFQADFSIASGYIPVIKSAMNNEFYSEFLSGADGGNNIAALSAKVSLEQESYYFTSPAFYGSSGARDEVGKLMYKCFLIEDGANVTAKIKKAFEAAVSELKYKYW